MNSVEFINEEIIYTIFDLGGQSKKKKLKKKIKGSERKKWIHAFEDVTALIYVSSLSEYDQYTIEDENQNRMMESLQLFELISSVEYLPKNVPILLFLNKFDVFSEKIKNSNLNICFNDYDGFYFYFFFI
jgi:hypothetical protein